jgi:hypothetical protein
MKIIKAPGAADISAPQGQAKVGGTSFPSAGILATGNRARAGIPAELPNASFTADLLRKDLVARMEPLSYDMVVEAWLSHVPQIMVLPLDHVTPTPTADCGSQVREGTACRTVPHACGAHRVQRTEQHDGRRGGSLSALPRSRPTDLAGHGHRSEERRDSPPCVAGVCHAGGGPFPQRGTWTGLLFVGAPPHTMPRVSATIPTALNDGSVAEVIPTIRLTHPCGMDWQDVHSLGVDLSTADRNGLLTAVSNNSVTADIAVIPLQKAAGLFTLCPASLLPRESREVHPVKGERRKLQISAGSRASQWRGNISTNYAVVVPFDSFTAESSSSSRTGCSPGVIG